MRFAHQSLCRMRNWNPVSLLAQRNHSALQVLRGQHEVDAERTPTSTAAVREGNKGRLWTSEDDPALKRCSEMGVEGEHPQSPCGPQGQLGLSEPNVTQHSWWPLSHLQESRGRKNK